MSFNFPDKSVDSPVRAEISFDGEASKDAPARADVSEMDYVMSRHAVQLTYEKHATSMKGVNLVTNEGVEEYMSRLEKCTPYLDEKKRWIQGIPQTIILFCTTASFVVPNEARACFYLYIDAQNKASTFFERFMKVIQKKGQFGELSNRVAVNVPAHADMKKPGVRCSNPTECASNLVKALDTAKQNPNAYRLVNDRNEYRIGTEDVSRMCMNSFRMVHRNGKWLEPSLPMFEWKDVPIICGATLRTCVRYSEKDQSVTTFRPWLITQWLVVDPYGNGMSSSAFPAVDMSFLNRPEGARSDDEAASSSDDDLPPTRDNAFENVEPAKRPTQKETVFEQADPPKPAKRPHAPTKMPARYEKYAKLSDVRAIPPEKE